MTTVLVWLAGRHGLADDEVNIDPFLAPGERSVHAALFFAVVGTRRN